MADYIEFPLQEGGTIIIEVDETENRHENGGLVPASRGGKKVLVVTEKTFDDAVEHVRHAADVLLKKLRSLHQSPDEIEVTFGLKASGELGGTFLVAKAGVEANYTVKLKWSKKDEETPSTNKNSQ